MKYYSYENFRNDTNNLIKKIKPLKVEAIIAIARGGLVLSHCIAEGLNIRNVETLRTELYDDTLKRDAITIYNNCMLDSVKKVLVLDDISDSGETLHHVMQSLTKKHKDIEFISATLFYKTTSIYKPDFWINDANEWIDFFWEKDFN
jgi:xanthine phosphoribosyltransferase